MEAALAEFKALQPKYVLEIGTYKGGTLYQWMKYARRNAVIVSVDTHHPALSQVKWQRFADRRRQTLLLVTGRSDDPEVIQQVHGVLPWVDWLFIDGAHDYATAKADWLNYRTLVRSGGIVALHDVSSREVRGVQVYSLWDKIRRRYCTFEAKSGVGNDTGMGLVFMP